MSIPDWQSLADDIRDWATSLGFAAVGFSDIDLPRHQAHLDAWLNNQYHGDMDYMARHGDMRSRPDKLHPGTVTVISVRMDYLEPEPPPAEILASDRQAYVSRYALGRDYHKVIRSRLKQLVAKIDVQLADSSFDFHARVFTDSAPLLEKAFAEKAGLGWIGKNTLLINERAGSWYFLGEVLTNLPLPPTDNPQANRCGTCSACIDVCPTDAIVAPYQLDARLCVSYLTIEHRGAIPETLRSKMGNRVFGCDDCQMVCPWNRYATHNGEADFKPRHGLDTAQLADLMGWREDEFLSRTEGSAIRRTGYQGWLRNLAVALGNSSGGSLAVNALQGAKGHSDLVDEHVNWALERLPTL